MLLYLAASEMGLQVQSVVLHASLISRVLPLVDDFGMTASTGMIDKDLTGEKRERKS